MSKGFLYYLTGGKHAVQLLVSIASVREVGHREPIMVCCGDREARDYVGMMRRDDRLAPLDGKGIDIDVPGSTKDKGKARQHCNKANMGLWSPFEKTIFLDADTLVVKHLEELWPFKEEIVLTQFCDWQTTGSIIRSRLSRYRDQLPGKVAMMLATPYPAINTGILSWDAEAVNFHKVWREITTKHPTFMGDEIVANLIFPDYLHRILDHRFNFSAHFSVKACGGVPDDVHVWHFHGGKHCREGAPIEAWLPAYQRCFERNLGGLRDWTPARDKTLRQVLQR